MSLEATLPTTIPRPILETILLRLAALFLTGAGGDPAAARYAAAQVLAAYHPQTTDQLRLAANIIAFSFQALEALGQAATPDMPLTRVLRLRGSAVTLSRESAKAERRLGQLQQVRQQAIPAQQAIPTRQAEVQPEPVQPEPKIEKAVALIADTGAITTVAKANNQTWTQVYEERQREARIAASIKKAEAKVAALAHDRAERNVQSA